MARRQWFDVPVPDSPLSAALLNDLESRKPEVAFQAINVKDPPFNAVGNGVVNDYVALQAALTAAGVAVAAGLEGATVLIPQGVFRYTTELSIPPGVSIMGLGRSSVLKPEGCDGMSFAASGLVGPQRFERFYIQGDNLFTQTGVKALGDADSGRIQGITFADVFLSHMKRGFYLRSTHGWHLDHIVGLFLWEGVYVAGQTILLTIDGGSEFSRDSATGSGESRGLVITTAADYNPGGVTIRGPEGIRVSDTTFFGFAVGVDHVQGLDTTYTGLTVGFFTNVGVRITDRAGGLRFRDSWMGFGNAGLYGVQLVALAVANESVLIMDGLHIAAEGGTTPDAASVGIACETNQTHVVIRGCTIDDMRTHDIRLNFSGEVVLEDNRCLTPAPAGNSIQLVAFPGGPYTLIRNETANGVNDHGSNTGQIIRPGFVGSAASATSLTLPGGDMFTISGTTTITSIAAISTWAGRVVRLVFSGVLTFTDGSNLKLAGNLTTAANTSINLACFDGTNWIEQSRSIN